MLIDPFLSPFPVLLEVSEAARLLRCSDEAVRRLLRDKKLKGRRLGNRWRILRADLETFIAALPEEAHRGRVPRAEVHPFRDSVSR